jgi:tetratricopeptide (TPR) repeat protein
MSSGTSPNQLKTRKSIMNFQKLRISTIAVGTYLLAAAVVVGADTVVTVPDLQSRWAEANYELQDKARLQAFENLVVDADRFTAERPDDVEGWIWSGIIKSTYAGAKGGLGALGLAKAARKDLERALDLDDRAMNGSAYTSLGTLYFSVPGWPVGFGSDKKAEQMLRKGLEINPDGIDSNYFYAEFLRDQHKPDEARNYYVKASGAAPRPGRPLADKGRQQEIAAALAALDVR